jgi:hypothetical protein
MSRIRIWPMRALLSVAVLGILTMSAASTRADVVTVFFNDSTESPSVTVTGYTHGSSIAQTGDEVFKVTLTNFFTNRATTTGSQFYYLAEPPGTPGETVSDVAAFSTTRNSRNLVITFDSTGWASLSNVPAAYGSNYGSALETGIPQLIPLPTLPATTNFLFPIIQSSLDVPEPSSAILLSLGGLGLIGGVARRQRKRSTA